MCKCKEGSIFREICAGVALEDVTSLNTCKTVFQIKALIKVHGQADKALCLMKDRLMRTVKMNHKIPLMMYGQVHQYF